MILRLLASVVVAALGASTSQAGLILSVSSASVSLTQPTAQVAVYAQTDTGTIDLAAFSLGLQISTAGNPDARVAFVTPLTDAQYTDPNYVFAGNSINEALGFESGVVLGTNYENDTYIGGDGFANAPVQIGTTPQLLLLIDVAITNLETRSNSPFTISILQDGSTQFFAQDANGDFVDAPISAVIPGVVGVVIPEPATLFMVGGLLGVSVWRRRCAKT